MKNLKGSIRISSVYLGTILGAGFASGQELLTYFAFYGINGMFGCLLSGMLFGLMLYMVLSLVYENNIRGYDELSKFLYPKWIGYCIDVLIVLFMLIIFSAMLAGSGALIYERFNVNVIYGSLFMAFASYIVCVVGLRGIVAVNSILAPVLLCGSLIVGVYLWVFRTVEASNIVGALSIRVGQGWIYSVLIYVAYNVVTAIVVISGLKDEIKSRNVIAYSSFYSAIGLGLIGLCLGSILLINYNQVIDIDIPLLEIVKRFHLTVQYTYLIVLISAMFTTAIATGFGVVEFIKNKFGRGYSTFYNKMGAPLIVVLLGLSLSKLGFANFIRNVYPLFGYIGIFEMLVIGMWFGKSLIKKGSKVVKE